MVFNLIFWSPLISFILISLLYPFMFHARAPHVVRAYAALLLLPGLISFIYIIKITLYDSIAIQKSSQFYLIPIIFGLQIDGLNAILLLSTIVLLMLLIFLSSQKKLIENILLTAVSMGLLYILIASCDQLIKLSVFSIGTVVFCFFLIHDELDIYIIKPLSLDFLIQRVSDFLALAALLMIVAKTGTLKFVGSGPVIDPDYLTPRVLYFSAIILKFSSLIYVDSNLFMRNHKVIRYSILKKIYMAAGCLILLQQIFPMLAGNMTLNLLFSCITIILFFPAWILLITKHKTAPIFDHLLHTTTLVAVITIFTNYIIISTAAIICIITIYPVISLLAIIKTEQDQFITEPPRTIDAIMQAPAWVVATLKTLTKLLLVIGNLLINIVDVIYARVALYHVPKMIVGTIQIPLRIFYNGNIQRSMFFASIVIMGCIYWWSKQ